MRSMSAIAAGALTAMAGSMLISCSGEAGDRADSNVVQELQHRREAASRVAPYDEVEDLLPNRTYQMGSGPIWQYSTVVVKGRFGSATAGKAYSADDSPSGVEVPFDGPAEWRTFHVSVTPDEVIAGRLPAGNLTMGLALSGTADVKKVEKDLASLGEVVLFLGPSDVYAYADGVLGSVDSGELIGQVDSTGKVTFPVLKDGEKAGFDDVTLDNLAAAAKGPRVEVQLDASGATVLSEKTVS